MSAVPTTILGGYLGAGKTTLVNGLLRRAGGRRLAVLVNELGELPIDEDLIEGREGNLLAISGGCVCCSYGSDLVAALLDLVARRPLPDHVVVETSGVALPGAVARSIGLVAGLALDGVVVLADAETIVARASDRYLADTIARQVDAADLLVLTKLDLLDPAAREARRGWVRARWPAARIAEAVRGDVPAEIILGRVRDDAQPLAPMDEAPHGPGYARLALRILAPVRAAEFATALATAEPSLLRAKGFVTDPGGVVHSVQVVGRRGEAAPVARPVASRDMVVAIGLPGMSGARIASALRGLAPVEEVASASGARWPAAPGAAPRPVA